MDRQEENIQAATEIPMATIINQLPDLEVAELHAVAEFIANLKLSRKLA